MTDTIPIVAERRERIGTGAAREARRSGRLPAVIYGNQIDPVAITFDPKQIQKQIDSPGFHSHIFEIDVEGSKHRVLARDLQTHPVSGKPIHLDFLRFSARSTVTVDVTIVLEGEDECPGLKLGGLVNMPSHMIQLVCRADSIPESLTVDISSLNIGDAIHVRDLALPSGAELGTADSDATVVGIAAPKVAVEVDEEEEAAEEGEETEEAKREED